MTITYCVCKAGVPVRYFGSLDRALAYLERCDPCRRERYTIKGVRRGR
jgi:hypothetical protein